MAADLSYSPKVHKADGGDALVLESGAKVAAAASTVPGLVQHLRSRQLIAAVNAGATLLAAVPGYKYRLVDCWAQAYGGAVGAVTTVDILGTQTSGVKLVAFAQANLTENTVLKAGGTGAAVLAAGASFVPCDAGTAITVGITGSSITTATGIDFLLSFVLEVA